MARREDLLQRRQVLLVAQALHRPDVRGIGLDAEQQTRADGFPVEQHRARTAHALFAPDVRPRVAEIATAAIARCSRIAPSSRSGVIGMSSISTPRCASASDTAFAIAAGAPIMPPSPIPLAPVAECVDGVSR